MTVTLVPHGIRGTRSAPGLGKDKGMEVFQKARGCLCAVPSSRLLRLPCLYPSDTEVSLPKQAEILRILDEIRIRGANTHRMGSDNETAPYQNSLR